MDKHKHNKNLSFVQFYGLVRWSLLRHRYFLPAFSLVQIILAVAIVYGFSLITPVSDYKTSVYFSSGSLTLVIIAVGCVLAPQIVSDAKHNGVFKYQRSLPIARFYIIISDLIIWSLATLPGIIMSCIIGISRFDIKVKVNLLNITMIIIILISMILIGFTIAYLLPPNMVSLVSQVIMIGTLLFSPILYPMNRLPNWTTFIYHILPFVPVSKIIRSTLFDIQAFNPIDLVIVLIWAIISFRISLSVLSRRE